MYSRKGLDHNPVSTRLFKNFRMSIEQKAWYKGGKSGGHKRMAQRINNKRARRLDYNRVMGFEE